MVKKAVVILLALLVIMPIVAAIDTPIKVNTLPNHRVSISILDPSQVYYLIQSFHVDSDAEGVVNVAATTENIDTIHILVVVKKDGVKITSEKFENYAVGVQADLDVFPPGFKPPKPAQANTTENNSTNQTQESAIAQNPAPAQESTVQETSEIKEEKRESSALTGAAVVVKDFVKNIPKIAYYILGAIIIVGVVVFLISRGTISLPNFSSFRRDPALNYKPAGYAPREMKELVEAEKKIKEAQAEINRIRNKEKITAAEKRVEEAKRELQRLKSGDD